MTELNSFLFLATTVLNSLVYIVRLSSPLAFPVASGDALIFLEATILTMESSARKLYNFSLRKNIKDRFGALAVPTASAGQTKTIHTKPLKKQNRTMRCAGKPFVLGAQGLVQTVIIPPQVTGCQEVCSLSSTGGTTQV